MQTTKPDEESDWDLEIKPGSGLLSIPVKELWRYRDLLGLIVRRDFVAFYKQTILGPLWFFVQPVVTIVFYSFVFGNLAAIPTDSVPKPLFYLAGIILWNYFSDCLIKTSTVFRDNSGLMGKVYFPRLILPLSIIVSNLIRFGIQLLLFIVLLFFYNYRGFAISLNVHILLFPFLVLQLAALGLGLGMIISAVTTKYRDLAFLVSFGVPLLMYSTTVIYPLSVVELKYPAYSWIIKYNPLTSMMETFRFGFLGKGTFDWGLIGYGAISTIIVLFIGLILFNKVEKNFVDSI